MLELLQSQINLVLDTIRHHSVIHHTDSIWSIACVVAKHIPKDPTIEDPDLVTYT
jgi:uncharacterized membrane protein